MPKRASQAPVTPNDPALYRIEIYPVQSDALRERASNEIAGLPAASPADKPIH